jgi:cysteine desulfurase/selenocysteine lyase
VNRDDFPILKRLVHGHPLVYLDNAATTLKPKQVVDRIAEYYAMETANIHRGVHFLSEQGTLAFENVRETVRRFIGARKTTEIIFTRGTTESINLVAQSYGRSMLKAGDEILITHMEHHSNIVPWQMLCLEKGCVLKVAPINDAGELIFEAFEKLLSSRTKLVSVSAVSNALGTVNPIKDILHAAHARGIPVLIDGAQAMSHQRINVSEWDCEFLAFSGHKMFAPTGVGVLYGKEELLNAMPPVQGGGDMISSVRFEKTTYNVLPYKFEAGTPHIAGVIGLGEAIDYIQNIGMDSIQKQEEELLEYGTHILSEISGLRLIGTAKNKSAILSFILDDIHPHDIGTILDQEGIAIRTGHHCAQPVMDRFGVPATARASLAFYNTREDLDRLAQGLHKVKELFR